MANDSALSSASTVHYIASLANIPITPQEEEKLADGFRKTMAVVDQLKAVDTQNVEPTFQVTGLTNIVRDDVVDTESMLSQEEALSNAKQAYNGYFVVDQFREEK